MMQKCLAKKQKTLKCFKEDVLWAIMGEKERKDDMTEIPDGDKEELSDGDKEISDGDKKELSDGDQEISDGDEDISNRDKKEILVGDEDISDGDQEILDVDKEIPVGDKEISDGDKKEISDVDNTEIPDGDKDISDGNKKIVDMDKMEIPDEDKEMLDVNKEISDRDKKEIPDGDEIVDVEKEILDGDQEITHGYKLEISYRDQEILDVDKEISDGEKKELLYVDKKEIPDGDQEKVDMDKEIPHGDEEIVDVEKEISDGNKEIDVGEKEIPEGEEEIVDVDKEILDGDKLSIADITAILNADKKEISDVDNTEIPDGDEDISDGNEKIVDMDKMEIPDEDKGMLDVNKEISDRDKKEIPGGVEEIVDVDKEILDGDKLSIADITAILNADMKEISNSNSDSDLSEIIDVFPYLNKSPPKKGKNKQNGKLSKRKASFEEDEEGEVETFCKYNSKQLRIEDSETDGNDDRKDKCNAENEKYIIRDQNKRGIYIKKYRKKKSGRRIYDNTHVCFFCSKVVLHINLHLKTHRKQAEVRDILSQEKEDFTDLRKKGDDKHNREVIEEGKGEIIIARRSSNHLFNVTDYGPCPSCKEWVLLQGLKYHHRLCSKTTDQTKRAKKRDLIVQAEVLAGHLTIHSQILTKEVWPIMTRDDISKTAKNDTLIVALGEGWMKRNVGNQEKRKYYASARMRLCARLLIQLRSLQEEKKSSHPGNLTEKDSEEKDQEGLEEKNQLLQMWDFLKPQHFDNVVIAAIQCSAPVSDDLEDLAAPSNAIKLKYDISRLVNSKWALEVKKLGYENDEARECQSFIKLMTVEWAEKVTTIARSILNRRKFDEVKELPSPEDIEKLTKYLINKLQTLPMRKENFRKITVVAQTRLLLYNKRRSGELEVIKLQSYASRTKGTDMDAIDRSLTDDLTEVEMKLLETQDLMKVRGKRGRPVPVLIPPDTHKALAFLADRKQRKIAGIEELNPYLFPNSANNYARAYESLKHVCGQLNLNAPHRINSVSMRKYMATLTQMLNLDKFQMEWVYNHLGHTKAVHKEHYRQMSGLLERTQVSKLLLVQDLNLTKRFKGKKLEDMDITDIVFPDQENVDGSHNLCPQNLSVPSDLLTVEETETILETEREIEAKEMKEDEEESEDENEESEDDIPKRRSKSKVSNRQRWTEDEVAELNFYFKDFLKSRTTPRRTFVDKVKQKIRKNNGVLHMRENHLIIKKISNMNHK